MRPSSSWVAASLARRRPSGREAGSPRCSESDRAAPAPARRPRRSSARPRRLARSGAPGRGGRRARSPRGANALHALLLPSQPTRGLLTETVTSPARDHPRPPREPIRELPLPDGPRDFFSRVRSERLAPSGSTGIEQEPYRAPARPPFATAPATLWPKDRRATRAPTPVVAVPL
jgi:hypothetical protein